MDGGSCENVVSQEFVSKLQVLTKKLPNPYKPSWFKCGNEVPATCRVLISISISIGDCYHDDVWCDAVPMDVCPVLLGKPWQYDHDGYKNTFTFYKDNAKVVL